jgi:hypothetical protein
MRTLDIEIGYVHQCPRLPQTWSLLPLDQIRLQQTCHRHLEQTVDLAGRDAERGSLQCPPDDRMEQMPAGVDGERRQASQHLDGGRHHADFLMGFAQRRRLHRLAGIDAPARQRYLAGVMAQVRRPYGQQQMPHVLMRVEQDDGRGWT